MIKNSINRGKFEQACHYLNASMSFRMRHLLLLIFLGLISTFEANAIDRNSEQILHYKVLVNEEQKGHLEARIIRASEKDFSISLVTKLNVFFLNIISDIRLEYSKGVLVSASSTKHINGVRTEHTDVKRVNGSLHVTGSEIDDLKITTPVTFSVGRLYHDEPSGFKTILSERLGSNVEVHSIGYRSYELKQPDGTRNYFFYKDGVCMEMQTRMRGRKVRFILI
jgi:hypothetical protein